MTGVLESLGERQSVFRVVVLDIDGTIVGPDLVLSKRLRSAVASAQRAGTTVLIATGRILGSALDFSRELKTNGPLICFQGAVTADPIPVMWFDTRGSVRRSPLRHWIFCVVQVGISAC